MNESDQSNIALFPFQDLNQFLKKSNQIKNEP